MFALLSGAYEQWTRQPEYNVLILGLDGAGKTVTITICSLCILLINTDALGAAERRH